MTNEKKQEFTLKIAQANKTKLVVILYEMTLIYIDETKEAHEAGDRRGFGMGLQRARGCINELMSSLNFEYEVAIRILELYMFANKELARAQVRFDSAHLDNAAKIIRSLLGSYQEISYHDDSAPLMENTQTVYSGLTYGRTNVLDSLSHATNRGFRV